MTYHASSHGQPSALKPLSSLKLGEYDSEHKVIVLLESQVIEKVNIPTIYYFDVADHSGQIKLCVYGADGSSIKEGDILLLRGCYVKQIHDYICLNVVRNGKIIRIGSFTMLFSSKPDLSYNFTIPEEYLKNQQRKLQSGHGKGYSGATSHSSRPSYSSHAHGQQNSSKYYSQPRSNRERN